MVSFEDWIKLDLRIAKIVTAEPVAGSDKLIKLEVDLGEEKLRQVMAGIGKAYEAENLIDKQIVVIANLEPRMIMGLESQAMLLAASEEAGQPILIQPENQVKSGATVG